MVPLDPYADHQYRRKRRFSCLKLLSSDIFSIATLNQARNLQVTFSEKPHIKIYSFQNKKAWLSFYSCSDHAFNGTVVNWTSYSMEGHLRCKFIFNVAIKVACIHEGASFRSIIK